MLEGHQTDLTHSVFTTSPTAYDTEHITAVPEDKDQDRKTNLGMFHSVNFFLQLNLAFSLNSKMAMKLTSPFSLNVDFNPYL